MNYTQLTQDLNLNSRTRRLWITSDTIKGLKKYVLGTKSFLDSVQNVSIYDRTNYKSASDILAPINIVQNHFKNAKTIDLKINKKGSNWDFTIEDLVKFIQVPQMNRIEFNYSDSLPNSMSSTSGWVLLCLPEAKYFLSYKALNLNILSMEYFIK